jgi:hypothetical protein
MRIFHKVGTFNHMVQGGTALRYSIPEPVFVNVYGAQESIPPSWDSIPGFLKRLTNTGSGQYFIRSRVR